MDDKWFKQQQKRKGITAEVLSDALGRDRSVVSRIYVGRQKMTLDQAKVFAKVLDVPLDEVLLNAGLTDSDTAATFQPGFSDSDAGRWIPKDDSQTPAATIALALGGNRAGVDIWRVKTDAMALAGYLPGDFILVDTAARDTAKPFDVVLAQVYDNQTGSANTLLRQLRPPVLVTASSDLTHPTGQIVDQNNVVIMGMVIASWRI